MGWDGMHAWMDAWIDAWMGWMDGWYRSACLCGLCGSHL